MRTIFQDNASLIKDAIETFLTASSSSGTETLTVKSITGFAINQILLIGELGDENFEIIKTHVSFAPSGTTITLASNLTKTHDVYTKVRVIPYDQVEFSHADTITGDKTALGTIAIQGGALRTRYDDLTETAGYYFTRFVNTIPTPDTYSDYSDPIPYTGYEENTVAFAINYALKRNKMKSFTDFVDYQFCIDEVNACLSFITGKLKGWSNLLKLNYILGQTGRGSFKFSLPSDIWENKGNKSIREVRIGTSTGLTYKIWSDFEKLMEGVVHTQVRTQATAGSTTLAIDNSYDFPDTGSVNVYISGTLYTITYTGVTRSTTAGVLTGIPTTGTGAITVTIPVDTYVWKGEDEGEPKYYSVNSDGNLVIWLLPNASYDNLNIYLDYYIQAVRVDSDSDELGVFRYDCIKHWLTSRIRWQIKNDGKPDISDGDNILFLQILADYIRVEVPAHRRKRQFKINSITF